MRWILLPLCLVTGVTVAAETKPAPCSAPEHLQFDFWVGQWTVTTPDGKVAGENHIERSLGGCILHEQWTSATSPFQGESFNLYDAPRKVWHQSWVDNSGLLLSLEGGRQGSAMVLSGERPAKDGTTTLHRITWTPNDNGTVRQLWETSKDGGKSWTTAFDGLYTRKP